MHHHYEKPSSHQKGSFLVVLFSVVWLAYKSGTKPSRIVYPCQRAAAANIHIFALATLAPLLNWKEIWTRVRRNLGFRQILPLVFAAVLLVALWPVTPVSNQDVHVASLDLKPHSATPQSSSSDLFFVQNASGFEGNMDGALEALFSLMGSHGYSFYKTAGNLSGFIGKEDVVILKVNGQWAERGGTNTDLLKSLIQKIVDHPEGFDGEIVVADNAQFVSSWLNRAWNNAYDRGQSYQDVVNMFNSQHKVSAFMWNTIRNTVVQEYVDGDMADGYVVNSTANPNTGQRVTYPKFQTAYGTYVSFKMGVWNATEDAYVDNLKLINMPVLKTHYWVGVTAALKHYMGVVSQSLYDNHPTLVQGGLGTEIAQTRFPTLNLLDAIYVNANPHESGYPPCGPRTYYGDASYVNIIGASTDPVALDYWGSKYILMPAALDRGYSEEEIASMNPDLAEVNITDWPWWYMDSWHNVLNRTMAELKLAGYQVTMSETEMNVYVTSVGQVEVGPTADFSWTPKFPYVNESVSFNASLSTAGTAPIANYTWDFGDSNITTSSGPIISHTFLNNATYSVLLNVTDEAGLWNATSKSIVVLPSGARNILTADVVTSKTVVGEGYVLQVNVTVENQGAFDETFNVTVYCNTTTISSLINLTLSSRSSTILTFTWNTTGFTMGNYTMSAVATPVPDEINTTDNTLIDGSVFVTIAGDVDGDRDVDIFDVVMLSVAYGTSEGEPKYVANCDIDGDGDIDIFDIVVATGNYSRSWNP